MYFGDYLIERKIITPAQLIEALAFQLENLPSMIRIVHESDLVSSADLLDLIKSQIKHDLDIFTILLGQKKLTQTQLNEFALKQWSRRIPLGEVLVKLNLMTRDQLEVHLDSYFESKDRQSAASSKNDVHISDAALESLRELGIDTSALGEVPTVSAQKIVYAPKEEVNNFLTVFNEKQKNKMLKLIDFIEETKNRKDDVGNYINSLFRDLHLIKGAVFFSEIRLLERPISKWDESLEKALTGNSEAINNWCTLYLKKMRLFVNQTWSIREKIETDQTDEGLDENFNSLKEINENLP